MKQLLSFLRKPRTAQSINRRFAENDEMAVAALRKFGIPPRKECLPEIRELLEKETLRDRRFGNEYLRSLCFLLWSDQNPADAPAIARAKFSDFDAGCMIDLQFLECGDIDAVRDALSASDTYAAKNALSALNGWENSDERTSIETKIKWERDYYGV